MIGLFLLSAIYKLFDKFHSFSEIAIEQCQEMAEYGDVSAQMFLGSCYELGHLVEQNSKTALYWMKKAARHGVTDALFFCGICYATGKGDVEKDPQEAFRYFKQAAEQGRDNFGKNLHGSRLFADFHDAQPERQDTSQSQ